MQLSTVRRLTLQAATTATGLAAGFFYAYHVSVTRGHALVGDRAYVETMQPSTPPCATGSSPSGSSGP